MEVKFTPGQPVAGMPVTFTLSARDADSQHVFPGSYSLGSGQPTLVVDDFPDTCSRAFGPWDPPGKAAGSSNRTVKHTYTQPGTYEASFSFISHGYEGAGPWAGGAPGDRNGRCIDPYSGGNSAKVQIVVGEGI